MVDYSLLVFVNKAKYILRYLPISDAACHQCDFFWKDAPENLCKEYSGKHCDPDIGKGFQWVYKKF